MVCFFPWGVGTLLCTGWERVKGRPEWVGQQDPGPAVSAVGRKSPPKVPAVGLLRVTALLENVSRRRWSTKQLCAYILSWVIYGLICEP